MPYRFVTLLLLACLFAAARAQAQPQSFALDMQPPSIGPGSVVTATVSGARPSSAISIVMSTGLGNAVVGPFNGACGPFLVPLDIAPPVREIGRGRVTAAGTFETSFAVPSRLPLRLNGRSVYSQAFFVRPIRPPEGGCRYHIATSVVASVTVHVP